MNETLQTALQHKINTLQNIISRMSENSRNCKTWCVTLVAALFAFGTALPWYVLVLPILPFMYLDMYYLAVETFFITQHRELLLKHKNGKLDEFIVYDIESPNGSLNVLFQSRSMSIWPFYGLLFFIAGAIGWYLEHQPNSLGS